MLAGASGSSRPVGGLSVFGAGALMARPESTAEGWARSMVLGWSSAGGGVREGSSEEAGRMDLEGVAGGGEARGRRARRAFRRPRWNFCRILGCRARRTFAAPHFVLFCLFPCKI